MYKILFLFTIIILIFLIKNFSQNEAVTKNQELIKMLKKEKGETSKILLRSNVKKETGNVFLNKLNIGYYVMFENTTGEKTITLMDDNLVKFSYPLNDDYIVNEVGFWKTNDDNTIEIIILGNQASSYDEIRKFVFVVDDSGKKIISTNYEKLIYGDGGLVFYRK